MKPDRFVALYGAKHPSRLPKGFKVDKTAWGRQEVELALAGMKTAIETLPEKEARQTLGHCLGVAEYAYFPVLRGAGKAEASLELLKKQHALLEKWWAENKEQTYWHEQMQKLVAKGQTPEELAEAERQRRVAEAQAKLDAPIGEEQIKAIRASLVVAFEADLKSTCAFWKRSAPEGTEHSVRRVKEGVWEWVRQTDPESERQVETYTGPELIERQAPDKDARHFPLEGRFARKYVDSLTHKAVATPWSFYYDKLYNKWTLSIGPPNKYDTRQY